MTDVALVTGAGSGIGAATATRLASGGRAVVCADVDVAAARAVADQIDATGGQAIAVACDVTSEEDVERAVASAAVLGTLGVVVSNAGIVVRRSLADTTSADWDATMAVNAKGAFLVARAAVPRLGRGGSIVMVASVVAHVGFGLPAYTASKGAVLALARELAGEVAHLGIRVNTVSPGTVTGTRVTRMSLADPAVLARTVRAVPLGQLAAPEDVAGAIVFLCSTDARMITGHALVLDGGLSTSAYEMQRPAVVDA